MTPGAGDGLFGADGTGGDIVGPAPADGVGPLPGFDLPVVRLPMIGSDGTIAGLDDFDADLDRAPATYAVSPRPGPAAIVDGQPEPAAGVVGSTPPPITNPCASPPRAGWTDRAPGLAQTGLAAGMHTRPRVVDEPGIIGLSRRSRSRLGSRLFTVFFVLVFAVIVIQMFVALLQP